MPSARSRRKPAHPPASPAAGAAAMWVSWWRMRRSKQAAVKNSPALRAKIGAALPSISYSRAAAGALMLAMGQSMLATA